MTPELFIEWKKKKIAERDAGLAAQMAERAKNDRMRYILFVLLACCALVFPNFLDRSSNMLVYILFSGRELFLSDSSLFVDDAEAYEKYLREEESHVTEQKVNRLVTVASLHKVHNSSQTTPVDNGWKYELIFHTFSSIC